jgi:hypothetical protein
MNSHTSRSHRAAVGRVARTTGVTAAALLLAGATGGPALAAGDDDPVTGQRTETGKPTSHNPTGNNGTVFVHDVAGDHRPHDVPHVSCEFWVDLFGFDAGQELTISFAGQASTGKDVALGGTWTGVASDDDAGGAGNDFDLEIPFTADDLGVEALGEPHPVQGYHVKMTVETGEPGGHKYKVFWIEPCAAEGGGDTGEVHGSTKHRPSKADVPTQVLGERATRAPRAGARSAETLPFTGTGAPVGLMTGLGLGAVAAGVAMTRAGRRRTSPA